MRIYLAAPLFTQPEKIFNRLIANSLREQGHLVFLPQETEPSRTRGTMPIFNHDIAGLAQCNLVVACLDGADPDSGTAFEMGWAFKAGIPIVGFRTDFRKVADQTAPINIMLFHGCTVYFECTNTVEIADRIAQVIKERKWDEVIH